MVQGTKSPGTPHCTQPNVYYKIYCHISIYCYISIYCNILDMFNLVCFLFLRMVSTLCSLSLSRTHQICSVLLTLVLGLQMIQWLPLWLLLHDFTHTHTHTLNLVKFGLQTAKDRTGVLTYPMVSTSHWALPHTLVFSDMGSIVYIVLTII